MRNEDLCKHCKKRNNCDGFVQREHDRIRYVDFCPKFINDDGTPFSNADRIRAMSDEELAKFLSCTEKNLEIRIGLTYGILEWLKQEVVDD